MRSSIRLFTMFGIPVHLHWTFGLIFIYAFYIGNSQGAGWLGTLWIVGLFIALFGCVLLHEFGHSLTARRFGVHTQDIILTPIGGIARLERMPDRPVQEFWVAVMGPVVNVLIAIILYLFGMIMYGGVEWMYFRATIADYFFPLVHFFSQAWALLTGAIGMMEFWASWMSGADGMAAAEIATEAELNISELLLFLPVLVAVNLWLVIFNMIPAFPMDGGRVFRSLVAMRIGRVKATRWASLTGQGIALLFVLVGFAKGAFTLMLIGLFVFTTARSENNMVALDDRLRRYTAEDILRKQFTRLGMGDWMQTPRDLLKHGLERHFLVFNLDERLVGSLSEASILMAEKRNDLSGMVSGYMDRVEVIHPLQTLSFVHHLMAEGVSIIAVSDGNALLGVIDREGFQNFLRRNKS
jgi:Zn-dependent protease